MSGDRILAEIIGGRNEAPKIEPSVPTVEPLGNEEDVESELLEPYELEEYQAFDKVPKVISPYMFDLYAANGKSLPTEYHTVLGMKVDPSRGILLTCQTQKIFIEGQKLRPLVRSLKNHRVTWMQEFNPKRWREAGQGSVITSIRIFENGQNGYVRLADAISREIQELIQG